MKLLKNWKIFNRSIVLIISLSPLFAQQGEIVGLTKHIGHTLDAEENLYYKVFNDIPNFNNAQFFQVKPNRIIARISFVDFTKNKISRRAYTLKKFNDLQLRLKRLPEITDKIRSSFSGDLIYLRTKKVLENIPKGQFVSVKTRSNKWVKGTLLSFEDNQLKLQTPFSLKEIPLNQMSRINYRQKIINRPKWKSYVYGLGALMGLGLMETWNSQTAPDWGIKWHNRFSGAIFGLLAGAEIYDISMILLSKKTQFALTPKELDKLKD